MSTTLTIVNEYDGTVSAHKAGCRDLGKARSQRLDMYTDSYSTKREVFLDYNADFLADGTDEEYCHPIDFKNCCTKLLS